mmetsp:Transcript_62156/g.117842  ORF Transcript_62156/g.117842 Transcript_62156/m.117842 type:complete len:203 (+) Transcript_62156:1884-2492(+)
MGFTLAVLQVACQTWSSCGVQRSRSAALSWKWHACGACYRMRKQRCELSRSSCSSRTGVLGVKQIGKAASTISAGPTRRRSAMQSSAAASAGSFSAARSSCTSTSVRSTWPRCSEAPPSPSRAYQQPPARRMLQTMQGLTLLPTTISLTLTWLRRATSGRTRSVYLVLRPPVPSASTRLCKMLQRQEMRRSCSSACCRVARD